MNLLAKKFLSRFLKPGLIMLIPVFFGCETQGDLGIQYDLGSDANVRFVEFTLPATNMFLDSLRTDSENRVLTGRYTDPVTGGLTAEGYFEFLYDEGPLPRGTNDDADTIEMDSIVVILETTTSLSASSNAQLSLSLAQLEEELSSVSVFLSSTKQDTITTLRSFSRMIDPAVDTLFRFSLDSAFSQLFFNNLSTIAGDDDQFITATKFQALGLFTGEDTDCILSFDLASDTASFVLYSSPVEIGSRDTSYLTYFRFTGADYTYLERDRTGSQFEGINEQMNFDLNSNETLIDPLAGITTAFDLSQITDFFEDNPNIIINNATLAYEFEAEDERDTLVSFVNFFRKPDLSIFGPALASTSTAFNNVVMSDNAYLRAQFDPATGRLSDNKEEVLIFPTLFFQQLYGEYFDVDSLAFPSTTGNSRPIDDLVLVSPANVTLQRTVFKEEGIKLRLYYTEVEQ